MRDVYADNPDVARYAGFWIRVAANVLDVLWMAALNRLIFIGVGTTVVGRHGGIISTSYDATALWLVFGPSVVTVAFWILKGATPGKMICGLRIVDEPTGGRPGVWQCIGRYVMAMVALGCACVGYLYLIIDPRKQGLHDKVVRTLVVRRG